MADKSKIEWTDMTWNPVTGCTKVSQGCKNCYAERLFPRPYPGRLFTEVRCHPERLEAPLHWRNPRKIFVNSMSDLFHEDVPDEFIDQVFAVMCRCCPRFDNQGRYAHIFQVLTKRPKRMRDYMTDQSRIKRVFVACAETPLCGRTAPPPWPLPNVWLGVSVEDQATADERIPLLLQTPAAVRFISAEPLLGPVTLPFNARESWCPICKAVVPDEIGKDHESMHGVEIGLYYDPARHCASPYDLIHWVIAGGESGPKARPSHPDWLRSLRDQCAAAGVAFFMKQITERGRKIPYEAFPPDLQIREYPA